MVQCAVHVIHDMRFLVPVVPGDRLDIDVKILKLAADVALVDGTVTVGRDHCRSRKARLREKGIGHEARSAAEQRVAGSRGLQGEWGHGLQQVQRSQ